MLHPFDLHVLATPPAFKLSQDQTLQLNFLDTGFVLTLRVITHGTSSVGVQRQRLTVSEPVLILEMSLSAPTGIRHPDELLLPHQPARTDRVSQRL